jgi:hypothetical protein
MAIEGEVLGTSRTEIDPIPNAVLRRLTYFDPGRDDVGALRELVAATRIRVSKSAGDSPWVRGDIVEVLEVYGRLLTGGRMRTFSGAGRTVPHGATVVAFVGRSDDLAPGQALLPRSAFLLTIEPGSSLGRAAFWDRMAAYYGHEFRATEDEGGGRKIAVVVSRSSRYAGDYSVQVELLDRSTLAPTGERQTLTIPIVAKPVRGEPRLPPRFQLAVGDTIAFLEDASTSMPAGRGWSLARLRDGVWYHGPKELRP